MDAFERLTAVDEVRALPAGRACAVGRRAWCRRSQPTARPPPRAIQLAHTAGLPARLDVGRSNRDASAHAAWAVGLLPANCPHPFCTRRPQDLQAAPRTTPGAKKHGAGIKKLQQW